MADAFFPSLGSSKALDRFLSDLYVFHVRGGFTQTFVYFYLYSVKVSFVLAVMHSLWPPHLMPMLLFFVSFACVFVAMHMRSWIATTVRYRYISDVYKHVLQVDVTEASWAVVCAAIERAQNDSDHWFLQGMSNVSEEAVRARVLRVDNVVHGIVASEVLPMYPTEYTVRMLRHLITTTIFDESRRLRRSMWHFRLRCAVYMGASLLLMPVVVAYSLAHISLHMLCSAHDRSSTCLFHRRWSCAARWSLRDVNEYPHTLQFRLRKAAIHGRRYLATHEHSLLIDTLRHTLSFITGASAGLLFFLSNMDDERWNEHHSSMLWWFATISAIHLAIRTPDHTWGGAEAEPGASEQQLRRCGQLASCDWGAAGTRSTYDRLRRHMPYQPVESARTIFELWRLPQRLYQWQNRHEALLSWLERNVDDGDIGCVLSEANCQQLASMAYDPMTRSYESFVATF